ncbi:MAG TPA: hypothetical protein VN366_02350 [Feifaniaceae bacterium]|nr:hypothetical protein [Feifaniaceae bacterium]
MASSSYDAAGTSEQTFTVDGTLTLPSGVMNPNSVPLDVRIRVTVNGRTGGNPGGEPGSTARGAIRPDRKPDLPVVAGFSVTPAVDANGHGTASISKKEVEDAAVKARNDGKIQGRTANGIGISIDFDLPDTVKSLGIVLPRATLKSLIDAGARRVKISGAIISLDFDQQALKELYGQSWDGVTITVRQAGKLPGAAKKLIGTRPVYEVTVS